MVRHPHLALLPLVLASAGILSLGAAGCAGSGQDARLAGKPSGLPAWDVVALIRVSTVTVDSIGDESSYHLGIQIGYPILTTPRVPDRTFELNIRRGSRAYGIVRAFDARLRGLTFIGFIRRFAGEAGEPELHWHLAPDTAEVATAVKEAVALGELSAP